MAKKAVKQQIKRNKSTQTSFWVVAVIAVALVLGFYLLKSNLSDLTGPTNSSNYTDITSDQSLLKSYNDLDETNIDNTIDPGLKQSSSDVQSY